jgi:hypothetical protein
MREQAQGHEAMPRVPGPHIVLVQADFALCLREALLDLPPHAAHAEQLRFRGVLSPVGQKKAEILAIVPTASDEQPAPHPRGARLREREARPDLLVRAQRPGPDSHRLPRILREPRGELRRGLSASLTADGMGARHHQRIGPTPLL